MFKRFDDKCAIKSMRSKKFDWNNIPNDIGVYIVVNGKVKITPPFFLKDGRGGYFRGKNPNVSIEELNDNWVSFKNNNEMVLYIGKAGGGKNNSNLRKRIKQYIRFGQGKPVGHWGGRYIWQLREIDGLYIYWKKCDNPSHEELKLLHEFKKEHGSLPFANLKM